MSITRQFGISGLAAAALAVAGVSQAAPIQMNLKATFADAKAAMAAGGQADIVVLGDSLAFDGLGWSSWVPNFRGKMQTRYGNAGSGYQSFSTLSGAGQLSGSWVLSGANEDHRGQFAIDGIWGATAQAGASARFILRDSQTELYYRTDGRAGSFNILSNSGQLLTTIDSRGSEAGVGVWSHDFGGGSKTIRIQSTENELVTILGANNKTANPGVRVHRASNSGYRLVSYLQRDVSFDQEMSLIAPDLVILAIGQNDGGIPASEYLELYSDLLDRIELAAPSSEILVVTPYNSGSGHLPALLEWQAQVAAAHGAGFLNLYSGIANGSRSFWWNNGYLYSDYLHFSAAGADYVGGFISDVFVSDGKSLNPWKLGDLSGDGLVTPADIDAFALALSDLPAYDLLYPTVWAQRSGDLSGDGLINDVDMTLLRQQLGVPTMIPEPGAWVLLAAGMTAVGMRRRRGGSSAGLRPRRLQKGWIFGVMAVLAGGTAGAAVLGGNVIQGGDFEDLSRLKLAQQLSGNEPAVFSAATDVGRFLADWSISAYNDPFVAWVSGAAPYPSRMNRSLVGGNGVLENDRYGSRWGQWAASPARATTGTAALSFDYLWQIWAGDDVRDWFNVDAEVPELLSLKVYGVDALPAEGLWIGDAASGYLDPTSVTSGLGGALLYEVGWSKADGDASSADWQHLDATFELTRTYAYYALVGESWVYGSQQLGWVARYTVVPITANAVDNLVLRLPVLPEPIAGDVNRDGLVNVQDINPFVALLGGGAAGSTGLAGEELLLVADLNHDGAINVQDINPFVSLLTGAGQGEIARVLSLIVPEPGLGAVMAGWLAVMLRRRGGSSVGLRPRL